jgi:hypothetical protein
MNEQRTNDPIVDGTSECPHCGIDTPHQHFIDRKGYVRDFMPPHDVIGRTRESEDASAQERRVEAREALAVEVERHIEEQLLSAMGKSKHWGDACKTCRMFHDGHLREMRRGVAMYMADREYGMTRKGSSFYCPDCGKCVWSDER